MLTKCTNCGLPKKTEWEQFIFENNKLYFCSAKCFEQNWKLFKKLLKKNRKLK